MAKSGAGEVPARRRIPPPLRPVASAIVEPFRRFAALEVSGSLVLLAATAVALVWANLPAAEHYFELLEARAGFRLGGFTLEKSLHHWINDGLMAIFFFVVGMEIKREILVGHLASPRKAALPLAGALGGMLVPAVLYAALNAGGPGAPGWGIPMATDIAFALGVLALAVGRGGAGALYVFLAALAIADDLGAVLVIALFYTADIDWAMLGAAAVLLVGLFAANRAGFRRPLLYALVGIVVWYCVLESGVHATVAGVLLAFTIPAWSRIEIGELVARGRRLLDDLARHDRPGADRLTDDGGQGAIEALERSCEQAQAPLQRLERLLHGWVAFLILPIFAFANAGVALGGGGGPALLDPITLGVVLGLVVGKPLGILFCSWAAVRLGWAALPAGVTFRQLAGVGCLGGIGFTMSLFIGGLAFDDPARLDAAKIGILAASVVSGILGWLLLRRAVPRPAAGSISP